MSSSTQGDSSELTRVQSCVSPSSMSRADLDQARAGGLLAVDRHGVLEVAEQDVDRGRDVGHLRDHLLVGEVEEVDHPRGLERDLADGSGASIASGLEEVAGVAHGAGTLALSQYRFVATKEIHERRNDDPDVETDQAAREASGAHAYGRYLEEFEVGAVYKHWPAKTITEADDHLFCLITMNHHPLHINDVYASQSQQGQNVVVGPLVYSLVLGMTCPTCPARRSPTSPPRSSSTRAGVPRRHAVRGVRGARGDGVALEARPRRGEGPDRRPQAGRHAGGRVQAPRARAAQEPGLRAATEDNVERSDPLVEEAQGV